MIDKPFRPIRKMGPFPYRAPRYPMLAYVDIFGNGMHLGAIQLHNLSAGGMGASGLAFTQREGIEVQLSGIGHVPARIVWIDNGCCGLQFETEICVDAFDLGGPSSGVRPFAYGQTGLGRGRPDDRSYPDMGGEGLFVRQA